MLLPAISFLILSTLTCANPVPQKFNDGDYLQNTIAAEAYPSSQDALIADANPSSSSSQDALIAGTYSSNLPNECTSDAFTEDETTQKRSILRRLNFCPSSSISKPNDAHGNEETTPSTQPAQSPENEETSSGDEKNPCKIFNLYSAHLYCGGPIIRRRRYNSVLNCNAGFVSNLPLRGMFRAASTISQFCCKDFKLMTGGKMLFEGVSCFNLPGQPKLETWSETVFQQWKRFDLMYSQPGYWTSP